MERARAPIAILPLGSARCDGPGGGSRGTKEASERLDIHNAPAPPSRPHASDVQRDASLFPSIPFCVTLTYWFPMSSRLEARRGT